ncbi:MAG: T9SS type A sorting domain-containing protein [Bacteroidetes bacterium]|nr:T9SS type A sorting domain-containing protein [Bacteroidota bacterium]
MTKTILGLLLLFTAFAHAQTGVAVTYYDGNVQNFSVATSGKLYFDASNVLIKTDASVTTPTTIPVALIRKITFDSNLANETFETANSLAMYPNPGADQVRISSKVDVPLKTQVYTLTGQLVMQGEYQPNQGIDVSGLTSGLYFFKINGVTLKFSKK